MPIRQITIPSGAQVPAAANKCAASGGGLIAGIDVPPSIAGTTYDCEFYSDLDSAWKGIVNEAGTARQLTLTASTFVQIDPPIRADLFRLNSDVNETGDRVFGVHII